MKQKASFLTLMVFLLSAVCLAQSKDQIDGIISQRAADSISKNAFSRMVAGSEDVANLANYISFVPTDGKFTLAGNYFFQVRKKDTINQKRLLESFAIGFNGTGSIVGGNVASIFETGKLATGIDIGLKISWRMNKPNVGSISSNSLQMIEKRNALQFERDQKIDSAKQAIALAELKLNQAKYVLSEQGEKLKSLNDTLTKYAGLLNACSKNDIACLMINTDSVLSAKSTILRIQQKIESFNRDITRFQEILEVSKIDATKKFTDRTQREIELGEKYGLNRIGFSYQDTVLNKIRNEYEEKIFQEEMARPVSGMRIHWLSAIVNWNQLRYRTYYNTLPFEQALTKIDTNGHTFGLQANFYKFYKPVAKARLFNLALLFKKTTNLEELSPSKLINEVMVVDGTTTRKSVKEYSVYTDSVERYNTVQLPINYYRFFGKDLQFGWHAFGMADWRDNGKQVYDLGAGFIFGLNSAGAKRLFNIELFAKYRDLKREIVKEDEEGWKQFSFGISVAVPFMIYKN
jgi:hypothetical protein